MEQPPLLTPELRDRIEAWHKDSVWKLWLCGDPNGKDCRPGLSPGAVQHSCGAEKPTVVWADVTPVKYE